MPTEDVTVGPYRVRSVMVVDDSIVQRDHTVRLCHELGIEDVREASNGREALAALTSHPLPDLLIVDLEMPTMDGPELLEQLQQHGIDIPIVIGSSHTRVLLHTVQDLGSVLGLRIVASLQKPLSSGALRKALRNIDTPGPLTASSARLPVDANALRAAIENREILVYFQPKANIRTGSVRGVEALARWHHPTLGFVPPEQFIPLAESSDLIHPLTLHVMNEAMLQVAAWHARGIKISLAVNLSPQLLERSDLAHEISSLQQLYGLAAEQVILEVTESSIIKRMSTVLGVLARLRMHGFGLSIDDFGTGFSSIQQLARIPFTELKIDRSLVHGAYRQESLQVILRSAIDIANQFNLTSVAEGIETMQDWRLVQRYGCTLGQGWLIGRPMPSAEFGSWLRRHRRRIKEFRERGEEQDSSAVLRAISGRRS
jgi:EAL domain-containing protein (putative c-di-GMP-specific phosphodiesterase class I)/DNA-binding NarL/FixJ family response regulator